MRSYLLLTLLLQYLSPYPVIRKIVRQNNTGNFSYVTFLANFLNATLTTVYGFLLRDNFMILVNRFFLGLCACLCHTFAWTCSKRKQRDMDNAQCAHMISTACSFGITVTGAYLVAYQRFYPKRIALLKKLLLWCIAVVGTCHFATIILEEASGKLLMGAAQNFVSIASFAAPLASLRVVFEHRSADSVPFLLTMMNLFSSLAWFIYGSHPNPAT
jgi:uncharacterized protein with PQ loop repeat